MKMGDQVHDEDVHAHDQAKLHLQPHGDLKYLGTLVAAAGVAGLGAARVYELSKERSGAWRPRIDAVEKKVKDVVNPLYSKVEGKEHAILLYFDHKLDKVVGTVRKHGPHVIKTVCDKAVEAARKAPDVIIEMGAEVDRVGVVDTAKTYLNKLEPVAEEWVHRAWQQFLKLPFSHTLVHVASPSLIFFGERVNNAISYLKEFDLPLVDHLPLLPVKRIEGAIKKEL